MISNSNTFTLYCTRISTLITSSNNNEPFDAEVPVCSSPLPFTCIPVAQQKTFCVQADRRWTVNFLLEELSHITGTPILREKPRESICLLPPPPPPPEPPTPPPPPITPSITHPPPITPSTMHRRLVSTSITKSQVPYIEALDTLEKKEEEEKRIEDEEEELLKKRRSLPGQTLLSEPASNILVPLLSGRHTQSLSTIPSVSSSPQPSPPLQATPSPGGIPGANDSDEPDSVPQFLLGSTMSLQPGMGSGLEMSVQSRMEGETKESVVQMTDLSRVEGQPIAAAAQPAQFENSALSSEPSQETIIPMKSLFPPPLYSSLPTSFHPHVLITLPFQTQIHYLLYQTDSSPTLYALHKKYGFASECEQERSETSSSWCVLFVYGFSIRGDKAEEQDQIVAKSSKGRKWLKQK